MTGVVGRIALAEAKDRLTGLPKWVYITVGIIAAALLILWWDARRIHAAEKRGSDAAYAAIAKKARAIEAKANALTGDITNLTRNWSDENARRISAGAGSLRLRGPGKAICTSVAGVAASPGGYEPISGGGNAPVGRVSYPAWSDLIAMPFGDLIDRAEKCDLNRSEVIAWREWHRKQRGVWETLERTQP